MHLGLGGPDEVVVSWASHSDEVEPEVEFWPWDAPKAARRARGSSSAYSQLLYLSAALLDPQMGAPGASSNALGQMTNTTGWAIADVTRMGVNDGFNHTRGQHGPGYSTGEAPPANGLQDYRNPQMHYTSPLLHTVTLPGLSPGQNYGYRVAGDTRTFTFTAPPGTVSGPHRQEGGTHMWLEGGAHGDPHGHGGGAADQEGGGASGDGSGPIVLGGGGGDAAGGGAGGGASNHTNNGAGGGGAWPFTFGLISDLGQTDVSAANVAAMRSALDRAQTKGQGTQ